MNLKNENWKKAYNKLAEDFFDLQHKYDTLNKDVDDLYARLDEETPLATESCCGQATFIADSKGVVERSLVVGEYKVTVTLLNDSQMVAPE